MTSPLEPNDLSHLSDEKFMALCPQGFHGTGDFDASSPSPKPSIDDILSLAHEHFTFRGNSHGDQFFATSMEAKTNPAQALLSFARAVLEMRRQCCAQRPKPLTDDEINDLWNCCGTGDEYGHHEGNIFQFARAIQERGQ